MCTPGANQNVLLGVLSPLGHQFCEICELSPAGTIIAPAGAVAGPLRYAGLLQIGAGGAAGQVFVHEVVPNFIAAPPLALLSATTQAVVANVLDSDSVAINAFDARMTPTNKPPAIVIAATAYTMTDTRR